MSKPPPIHIYLSTACLHGEHAYCQSVHGAAGLKTPAVCKFCQAPCICDCHQQQPQCDFLIGDGVAQWLCALPAGHEGRHTRWHQPPDDRNNSA